MKANADKCHLLVIGNYEVSANINEFEIESSTPSFEHHITSLCKKANQKLHVLCACKNSPLYRLRKTKILNESICNISI